MQYKNLYFVFLLLSLPATGLAQFSNIYEAKRYVIGSWESVPEEQTTDGIISLTIRRDPAETKQRVIFYADGTLDFIPPKYIDKDQHPQRNHWEIVQNADGNYYIQSTRQNGILVVESRYNFEGTDYLVWNYAVKFRREGEVRSRRENREGGANRYPDSHASNGLLRYDGYYQAPDPWGGCELLKFYRDGTVVKSTCDLSPDWNSPSQISERLQRGKGQSEGRFTLDNANIEFKVSESNQDHYYNYRGQLTEGMLYLHLSSYNGYEGDFTFTFYRY